MDRRSNLDKPEPQETQLQKVRTKKTRRKAYWPSISILVMIIIIILGILIGIQSGISKRLKQAEASVQGKAETQYALGVDDLENGRFGTARERFEYVLRLDPEYPGAADLLYQALLQLNSKSTVTPMPTPTPTPTLIAVDPNNTNLDEIFASVRALMREEKWDDAIATMDQLRQIDLNYRPVDIDGLYFISLRNRGIEKILQYAELEQGIYDLSLAERFAPLDKDADSYRTWARYYLTGASYWDVNWEQVIYYFSQVQPAFPNLRDGSGMTATERLRKAYIKYGDQLAATGDFCKAQTYYELSFEIGPDPIARPTVAWVAQKCWDIQNQTPIPVTETITPTPTETPEGWVAPTVTPTPTP